MTRLSEAESGRLTNSRIAEMVRRIVDGVSNDRNWKPAHSELLTELRARTDEAIVAEMEPVHADLGAVTSWEVAVTRAVNKEVLNAGNRLEGLRGRAQHLLEQPLPADTEIEAPTSIQWLVLLTMVAFFIVVEAGFNMMLLAPALDTGLLGAFVTAILASAVNVGFGAGSGMGISFLVRRFRIPKWASGLLFGAVAAIALVINLIVGRHRESFERLIEQREEAGGPATEITLSSARQLAAEIPLNPTTWELRSFLFFVLGVVLFGVGLYKGYTFVKSRLPAVRDRVLKKIDGIHEEFDGLSERHRAALEEELTRSVRDVVVRLDSARQVSRQRLIDLEAAWRRGGPVAYAESLFTKEYNERHPDKISEQDLVAHRGEPGIAPGPVDLGQAYSALDEADEFVSRWREPGGIGVRFAQLQADGEKRIDDDWMRYRSVIGHPLKELSSKLGINSGSGGSS